MKQNEEQIVLNFRDYTIHIDRKLERAIISFNGTEPINDDECVVETMNMTLSKKEILTIASCIDTSFANFAVGDKKVSICSDFDVFIDNVDRAIKIPAQEIRDIAKYFIKSKELMNEGNTTQDIYNNILNSNSNNPAGEIVKPIEAAAPQPKPKQSIYDSIVDIINKESKGGTDNESK